MINFLIQFPIKAPVDTVLLVATVIHLVASHRVLARANRRDPIAFGRIDKLKAALESTAKSPTSKSGVHPAE